MFENSNFAAFIMTYERPEILLETIQKLFQQSLPPSKILIVDNSISDRTRALFNGQSDQRIEYYHVGYNSGPAGAAYIGLKILSEQGFKWIFWGDDDDPPLFEDCFEKLLNLVNSLPANCGQIGAVGSKLNKYTGISVRVKTEVIKSNRWLLVDNIGGGMCKIISSDVVKAGILPDKDKFFGFEELDFDLKCQKAGFSLYVDCALFLRYRSFHNRINYKVKFGQKKKEERIWREYYSIRNIVQIFSENKMRTALVATILRKFFSVIKAFSYGNKYGFLYSKVQYKGFVDGFLKRKGFISKDEVLT